MGQECSPVHISTWIGVCATWQLLLGQLFDQDCQLLCSVCALLSCSAMPTHADLPCVPGLRTCILLVVQDKILFVGTYSSSALEVPHCGTFVLLGTVACVWMMHVHPRTPAKVLTVLLDRAWAHGIFEQAPGHHPKFVCLLKHEDGWPCP